MPRKARHRASSKIVAGMDPAEGQAAARACQACHTFEEGGAHRVGPNLWNVVGQSHRPPEGLQLFRRPPGKSDQTWTLEALDQFLLNPRGFAPGTKMAYGGMRRDENSATCARSARSDARLI
jgi:cytochrome c